jgi:geranylgeranyl transferase type-2 subunit beta
MIGRLDWIDGKKLKKFILASQDIEVGGIADCPGNHADPFHTVFGTAGLSLLASYCPEVEKSSSPVVLKKVNPVFCMSQEIIDRLGIPIEILTPKK